MDHALAWDRGSDGDDRLHRTHRSGSFWQSYGDGQTVAVGNPFQEGTMTLLTEEVAVFRFDRDGSETSIYFVRNDTPRPRLGCD